MQTSDRPKITPIGSCRITQPLRYGADKYGYELNKSGVYGYCHSSSEALQMVRYLQGDIDIPAEIWPLISKLDFEKSNHVPGEHYVVEISSQKSIMIDGWAIQLNYLTSRYPSLFQNVETAKAFWSLVDRKDQSQLTDFLQECDIADFELLSRITRRFATRFELRKDMAAIKAKLPSVLFVTHVNARQKNGLRIASRSNFITDVELCGSNLGATVYNPTEAMRFVGQAHAMADDSAGLAHFRDGFEAVIAADLAHYLLPTAKNSRVPEPKTLLDAAAIRLRSPDLAETSLRRIAEFNPADAAHGLFELSKRRGFSNFDPALLSHLPETTRHEYWALTGLGAIPNAGALSDEQLREVIEKLSGEGKVDRLDQLLLSLERPITPLITQCLDQFLSDNFKDRLDRLAAIKVVLKHAATHKKARASLYHIKTWLGARNLDTAGEDELDQFAKLNSALPLPKMSFDLALSREFFKRGLYQRAIDIGLIVHDVSPENLTLITMLMRAAVRANDDRQIGFAQKVIERSDPTSSLANEAKSILCAQETVL